MLNRQIKKRPGPNQRKKQKQTLDNLHVL